MPAFRHAAGVAQGITFPANGVTAAGTTKRWVICLGKNEERSDTCTPRKALRAVAPVGRTQAMGRNILRTVRRGHNDQPGGRTQHTDRQPQSRSPKRVSRLATSSPSGILLSPMDCVRYGHIEAIARVREPSIPDADRVRQDVSVRAPRRPRPYLSSLGPAVA